ncbi:hypothetical protein CC86DRAFT_407651 [Ophiobolus disseminans]|uniref:Gfd2/YDR514C-like C-terminal domain-containing protein n=1 Tax=Ophiobolus disseminans TaxID=1469910 RepID=A0A6A6ZXL9_9PLEO|nr:hypothetical protein CC86DRAFT_407651 [Ophiobolus disseminans]
MAQIPLIPKDQTSNALLTSVLANQTGAEVVRHFAGFPLVGMPPALNQAAIVCLDIEWWYKEPKPTTELGIAELLAKGQAPSVHAENILTGVQVAHARISSHAHLRNNFPGAGDPENFQFGVSKFVSEEEAKQVIINTFVRPSMSDGTLQPIILIGHAVENEFEHIQRAFGVDLHSYGTVVKVVDTQLMAKEIGIRGPKGPNISLHDLLAYFNIRIDNLHTAGNDAAGTLIAAVLVALRNGLYPLTNRHLPATVQGRNMQDVIKRVMAIGKSLPPPTWGVERFCSRCDRDNHFRVKCFAPVSCTICRDSGVIQLFKNRKTHQTNKCLFQYLELPPKDYILRNQDNQDYPGQPDQGTNYYEHTWMY